jgi:hypothetical protein
VLGSPFAIPLDGSSVTNDLLRVVSGPASGAAFVQPVDAATFVADPLRVLRPITGRGGARRVVERVQSLFLPDDGPGNGRTVWLYPADVLGNEADPPQGGFVVELEAELGLRIAWPDHDGDPRHETITFANPNAIPVVLDDAGDADDGPASANLLALVADAPAATVRLDATPSAAGSPLPTVTDHVTIVHAPVAGADAIRMTTKLDLASPFAADTTDLTLVLRTATGPFLVRTIAAGSMKLPPDGQTWRYADPGDVTVGRIESLVVRPVAGHAQRAKVQLKVAGLDLSAVDAAVATITEGVVVGEVRYAATLACTPGAVLGSTDCAH